MLLYDTHTLLADGVPTYINHIDDVNVFLK